MARRTRYGRQAGRQAGMSAGIPPVVSIDALRTLRAHHATVVDRLDALLAVLGGGVPLGALPAVGAIGGGVVNGLGVVDEDPAYVPERGKTRQPRRAAVRPRAHALTTPRAQSSSGREMQDDAIDTSLVAILTASKRALKASEICSAAAKAGHKPYVVMTRLRGLVKAGRVVKTGATVSLRYLTPELAARLEEAIAS